MLYRVHFHRLTRDKRRGTYAVEPVASVAISDHTVETVGNYAAAAIARRPELASQVSGYSVAELRPERGKLAARVFCSGNDLSCCRDFWK